MQEKLSGNNQEQAVSKPHKSQKTSEAKAGMPARRSTPVTATQLPIESKQALVIKDNPLATILQAMRRFFDHQISPQSLNIYFNSFYQAFELYMRNSKAMSGSQLLLKKQLYALETSIGKQGGDPRQNHELALLKEYLEQLGQKEKTLANQAMQLKAYIDAYQNRFRNSKDEQKLRGFRQIYVGKQSRKVLRIGYDATAAQHQLYLVDENKDQVIDTCTRSKTKP